VPSFDNLSASLQQLALTWLPILLLALLVFFSWRLIAMMPRIKPQQLKPDSASSVGWDDIAGLDEAKDELREVVDFLRDPDKFARLGARVPKGILLYGPPGTGKTLLAKAVAHESGAAFFSQSASSFVEMFAGVGASRIRKLFETARDKAPAIVFIDELDAVGASRTGTVNREQDQTLNQLLVELDGFDGSRGVVVLGASNRLDTLDAALLRPGRLDRHVLVSTPDVTGRQAILGVHIRSKPVAEDVDVTVIARRTAGLCGADLENICNEAAIRAGREGREEIIAEDFDWAVERVVAGLQTRRLITDREKRVIAYHEAGHAVAGHLLGEATSVQKVTIISRGAALGYTLHLPDEDRYIRTREELIDDITILLAGRAAELVVFGRISTGAASDLEAVTRLTREMVFELGMGDSVTSRTVRADDYGLSEETKRMRDAEQARLADDGYQRALDLCTANRRTLDRVAAALLERETLEREELRTLLDEQPQPADAPQADAPARPGRPEPVG
jgi:cell division protease FtsH